MKRRYVVLVVAAIAAVAFAAPGIGGKSSGKKQVKKLVRKEVSKQISKAQGPAGPRGLPGSARAYGIVSRHDLAPCSPNCTLQASKGISHVTHPFPGVYCVHAPGVDFNTTTAAATVWTPATASPTGNASAQIGFPCDDATGVRVETYREPVITVDQGAGTTQATGPAVLADDIGFTIVIP